jgi:hypothetical protein
LAGDRVKASTYYTQLLAQAERDDGERPALAAMTAFLDSRSLCYALLYVAKELPQGEALTDVQYAKIGEVEMTVASGPSRGRAAVYVHWAKAIAHPVPAGER